jgi:hypothetical protein
MSCQPIASRLACASFDFDLIDRLAFPAWGIAGVYAIIRDTEIVCFRRVQSVAAEGVSSVS